MRSDRGWHSTGARHSCSRQLTACTLPSRAICKTRKLWHRRGMFPVLRVASAAIIALALSALVAGSAAAAERIRLAVQKTGTLAWELDVIKNHGLDRKADLAIETVELASTEAGKIALKGGSADLMLSDWLWVARERSLGDNAGVLSLVEHARRGHGAGGNRPSGRSPISRAGSSPSPAVRSTRAGSCCRRWRAAPASISAGRRPSSTARRRC